MVGMAVTRGRVSPWTSARIATEFVLAYVLARLVIVGGPGAFPGAGSALTGPGAPRELKIIGGTGYDGQFIYRLALDPFTTSATAHGITFDAPAYRQQRIMTALLAHALHAIPGVGVAWALVVVNTCAVIVAIVLGIELAQDYGRSAWLGALIALPACIPASLALDLTEPLAWAGVLAALLAIKRGRWHWAAAAFTIAVLARETSAIFVFGYVVESAVVLRRDRTQSARLWLLVPIAVEVAWQARLWAVWGTLPLLRGVSTAGVGHREHLLTDRSVSGGPLFGVIKNFLYGLATGDTSNPALGATYLIERVALVGLIAATAWVLVTRRAQPGIALTVSWAVAVLVAFSMAWVVDVQFLRAGLEAWGTSVVVLALCDDRCVRPVLLIAASTTFLIAGRIIATV